LVSAWYVPGGGFRTGLWTIALPHADMPRFSWDKYRDFMKKPFDK